MEEDIIKRVIPANNEAERAVIGSMLMSRDAITTATDKLRSSDFYNKQYGVMFDTIVAMHDSGEIPDESVDIVTLQNHLRQKDFPEEMLSLDALRDILYTVSSSVNIAQYAQIVYEKSMMRRLIKINEELSSVCYGGQTSLDEILARTEKDVFSFLQSRDTSDGKPINDVMMEVIEKIENASKSSSTVTGIPTGFTDLDYMTTGLQNSDLILMAARPSMGKTAFVLNVAQYAAVRKNYSVAIFSLEMSAAQLGNRLLSMESGVDSQKLRTGKLSDTDWYDIVEATNRIAKANLIIDDTPGITVNELRSKARKYKLEKNLQLIIIDYLQLMSGSGRSSDSRQQEISEISRSLKALARELKVPVIALSQLSRACETRTDHRPMLSDLRESGAIEQDADVVMFLYRDNYYNKESDPGLAEVIVAKQRNGPTDTVHLAWLADRTKFANLEKREQQHNG
ncbi:MAG: replicative DNA helicase [Lachnospiraceae bacterium]|nr:replicative DNA helicase [Lachnospiraceae bacterium]